MDFNATSWPLCLAFMAQLGTLTESTRHTERESPAALDFHQCSRPTRGNFASIKSEYDHFNGLTQFCRLLFMNTLLLEPETRTIMSNQEFLADIQPGAAPVMIITWRLNIHNIILNFTHWVLYIIIIHMLLSPWNHPVHHHTPFLSPVLSGAIYIMAKHQVRGR